MHTLHPSDPVFSQAHRRSKKMFDVMMKGLEEDDKRVAMATMTMLTMVFMKSCIKPDRYADCLEMLKQSVLLSIQNLEASGGGNLTIQ